MGQWVKSVVKNLSSVFKIWNHMSIHIWFSFSCSKLPHGSQHITEPYTMFGIKRELLQLIILFLYFSEFVSVVPSAAAVAFPTLGRIQGNTGLLCGQGERCCQERWTPSEGHQILQNGFSAVNHLVVAHKWIANGKGIMRRNLISYNNSSTARHGGAQ